MHMVKRTFRGITQRHTHIPHHLSCFLYVFMYHFYIRAVLLMDIAFVVCTEFLITHQQYTVYNTVHLRFKMSNKLIIITKCYKQLKNIINSTNIIQEMESLCTVYQCLPCRSPVLVVVSIRNLVRCNQAFIKLNQELK